MGHGAGEKAVWRKNGEWTGTSRMRSRVAKKLDEQRRKLQKELRDIDKFSCVCRKSFRKTSRVTCNSSCKRWSKGGMTSCQNTRKCRRYRKKIQSIQDRRRNLQGIETDLSIQLPKSTSDGSGCSIGRLMLGNGTREFFLLRSKKKRNSQGEDPRTCKEPVEKCQVQKKRKEKKWKKKKKKVEEAKR